MALSDDQRAMLRLLAQREEGYEDIAALMGLSVDEVRSRVRAALAELDAPPAETPSRQRPRPARRQAAEEERSPAPAAKARPARDEPPKAQRAHPAPRPRPGESLAKTLASLRLPEDRGRRRLLLGGLAAVIVVIVLFATGVFGGGSGGTSQSARSGSGKGGKVPTQAVLKAVGGGEGEGVALFGRTGQQVVLLLSAKGLSPSPAGHSYTVSLVRSPSERLPLVATKVGKSGTIAGRFQVAAEVLGLLANGFDRMEVSLVGDQRLKVALAQAKKSRKAPAYGGEAVLRGTVTGPIVEAGEG